MANVDHLLPRVGEQIGPYQLVQELARGGFSVVFRATQITLNADVAVKFLAPPSLGQVQSQQLLQRFQQEARVAQKLQHPCAIKVRDYGQTPAGLLYQVTDFIDGRVLSDVLKEQPLSVDRTARIARQVLACLIEAHGLGIVHRDLKPDNIMLRDFSSEKDVVTVLDFGVAKVSESYDGVVTQVGMTLGTPYYTAPEQCRGERSLDGRADLYSVGLIIAECLTGRRVVGMDSQMAAIYIHAGAQPLEFEPALHQNPLFPVIQRATQKPKEWRFADAAQMREALEVAAAFQPPVNAVVETRPYYESAVHDAIKPGWSSGPLAPPRRGSLTWLWATAVLVVGAAALVLFALLDRELGEEPASHELEQREPTVDVVPVAREETVLAAPRDESSARRDVRASIQFVDDAGPERRVSLVGCGFASGLLVGERAPLGDTGLDLEITRLRDDSHCTATTLATEVQVEPITEVVFPAPRGER